MTRSKTSRSSAGHVCSSSRDEGGFTLAEVIVAIAVFMVVMVATTSALVTVIKTTRFTRDRVAASSIARQTIERLRAQSNTGHSLDIGALPTQVVYGQTYTATVCMTRDADSTTYSCAAVPACLSGHQWNVTVTVDWTTSDSRRVQYDTVIAC